MKVVIIEDEKPAARLLARELLKLGIEVHHILHSVEESLLWFSQNNHPDLVFADIQLTDGLSLEIFEKTTIKSGIIFVTSFDQYAIQAMRLNGIDYLLKPIDTLELQEALQRYEQRKISPYNSLLGLKEYFYPNNYIKRFVVKIGTKIKLILVHDVPCIYKEDRGIYIHTENRGYLLEESSLDKVCDSLDPKEFFRVNRQQVVALGHVKQIVQISSSRLKVILHGFDHEIIVSRERVPIFKSWLENN